jgi:hypothetical protein
MPKKTIKPVVNIDALLESTMDLESGHPVEGVLKHHGIHRDSAYETVERYKKNLAHYESAVDLTFIGLWRDAVKELEPVVKAIEEFLEVTA